MPSWLDGTHIEKRTGLPVGGKPAERVSVLRVYSTRDGKRISEVKLESEPVWDSAVAAYGQLLLSLRSGKVIWKNETTAYRWMHLPHGVGYGGVAPQGYLALYKGTLYVAAGRAAPAILDAKTGELLYHEIGRGYKAHYPGGSWVMASHDWIIYKRRQCHKDADVRYDERSPKGAEAGIVLNH